MRSAVSEVLDGTVHLKTGPASVTSSSAQRGRERDLIQDIMLADADEGMVHAEMVQLSDQGVTGLGDEESTAIGWLTAAVQKCARALDLARCLEGTLIGDGRALTI